ncbi:MAG: Fe-S cluster assembly protein SufD [Piscirickettsiaceae bacterium]|nr:Fe-S cluster assembly protein SufD [Piscirickettsiaceae bacterium]
MKQLTDLATDFASVAESSILAGQDLAWLNELRQQAAMQFKNNSLPAKKVEDWKYTSLWSLSQQLFTHDADTFSLSIEQCDQLALIENTYRIVIVDGVFSQKLSTIDSVEDGLNVSPFSASVSSIDQVLGQQVDLAKAGLTALNTMLMNEGVVITVAEDVHIEKPIELLVINSGTTQNLAIHLRNVIKLEANSKATVIEHYVGLNDESYFTNVVTEVSLAENAELKHYKLQQESDNAFHIATLAAKQATSSQWLTNSISLGGKLVRNDVHSQLLGEQSHVTMDGLYLLNDEQHIDNHTRIDHVVPNTTSEELYKGVLDDNSHAVFNGKVIVHKDAQKTDANQQNKNLLLSRGCEIDSKPEMEIYADDVKCGHGSTVGQIDKDQLFYLRTRGLDEVSARSLLTHAFAVDVLDRIPAEDIRNALSKVIERRLPQGGISG